MQLKTQEPITETLWWLGYELDVREITVQFSAGTRIFYLLLKFQVGTKAHSGSCSVDTHTGVSFLGKSRPDVELAHSLLYRAEVNN